MERFIHLKTVGCQLFGNQPASKSIMHVRRPPGSRMSPRKVAPRSWPLPVLPVPVPCRAEPVQAGVPAVASGFEQPLPTSSGCVHQFYLQLFVCLGWFKSYCWSGWMVSLCNVFDLGRVGRRLDTGLAGPRQTRHPSPPTSVSHVRLSMWHPTLLMKFSSMQTPWQLVVIQVLAISKRRAALSSGAMRGTAYPRVTDPRSCGSCSLPGTLTWPRSSPRLGYSGI